MRLTVTSLEDRTVPHAGFGGLGGLGHGLGRLLNADPTDVNKLLTDVQAIINRQVPAPQLGTLLADAQTLAGSAAGVSAAAQTDGTTLVNTVTTVANGTQVSRQQLSDIQSAAQTLFRDLRHTTNTVPQAQVSAVKQDLRSLRQAFAPTADDRNLIRSDLRTIWQDLHGTFVGK
jgi:hypothetical protein